MSAVSNADAASKSGLFILILALDYTQLTRPRCSFQEEEEEQEEGQRQDKIFHRHHRR
jgi:hypothetical protein